MTDILLLSISFVVKMHLVIKLLLMSTCISIVLVCIGVGVGIGVFFRLHKDEINIANSDFSSSTTFEIRAIENTITSTTRSVHTISSFFNVTTTDIHPYQTFLPLMESSQSNIIGTHSLGWISRIERNSRNDIVTHTRGYGDDYSDFDITIRNSTGVLISAPISDVYYVLQYIYPIKSNLGALGFNVMSEPVRKHAIERSIASGIDAVTSRIFLPHTKYQQPGVLYISPLLNATRYVRGFGVGVFIIGDIFSARAGIIMDQSIIVVFDNGALKSNNSNTQFGPDVWDMKNYTVENFLWTNMGEYGPDFGSINHIRNIRDISRKSPFIYIYSQSVGDRNWDIVFIPKDSFISKYHTGGKWIALMCLVFGAVLLSAGVYIICGFLYIKWRSIENMHAFELKLVQQNAERTTRLLNRISRLDTARKQIFNTIPDIVIVVDETGKILYANNIFFSMTGIKDQNIRDGTSLDKIFIDKEPLFHTITLDTFQETTLKPSFGKNVPVIYNSFPIDISPKSFSGEVNDDDSQPDDKVYVIIARDLSDNKALLSELQSNKNRIQFILSESEFERRWKIDFDGEFKKKLLTICKRSKNEENVYFMQDVDKYRAMTRFDQRVEEQERLINVYISEKSQRQLNIINSLRVDLLHRAQNDIGDPSIFDNIYTSIKISVATEIFPILKKEESI